MPFCCSCGGDLEEWWETEAFVAPCWICGDDADGPPETEGDHCVSCGNELDCVMVAIHVCNECGFEW